MSIAFRFDVNSPTRTMLIQNYNSTATTSPSGQVRNDRQLAFSIEPVTSNPSGSATLYSPDWLDTDVFELALGTPDQPANGGTFGLQVLKTPVAITSSSVADPTNILSTGHGLTSGDTVFITGHTGSTPAIEGYYVATVVDSSNYTIPVNVTVAGTGGTGAKVTSTGLTVLPYNISTATLQTALNTELTAAGFPNCVVTAQETVGTVVTAFAIQGATNGAIPSGTLIANGVNLLPQCDCVVFENSLGTSGAPYLLLLIVRQSPIAFATPTTPLPAATVAVNSIQAGSATTDEISEIDFGNNPYAGTFSVGLTAGNNPVAIATSSVANPTHIVTSAVHGLVTGDSVFIEGHTGSTPAISGTYVATVIDTLTFSIPVNVTVGGTGGDVRNMVTTSCGVANVNMTPQAFGVLLANHPQVNYLNPNGTPNNIVVSQNAGNFRVQFIGTLGSTASNVLTAANIDLQAPEGVSGFINFNTFGVNQASFLQNGLTFSSYLSIQRTRASGEVRTIWGPTPVTLSKEIIDIASMIPTPLPSYYTAAQSDARYGQLAGTNTWTGTQTIAAGGGGVVFNGSSTLTMGGIETVTSGGTSTFASGSTLTVNGSFAGTPTGGTLDLTNVTLTLNQPHVNLLHLDDGNLLASSNAFLTTFTNVSSSVNNLLISNSATGNPVIVHANGTDTNVSLNLTTKGTGVVEVNGTALGTAAFTASTLYATALIPINAQTGTTYTLVIGDSQTLVTMNNASANTITVPTNASVAFPVGTQIAISQVGAGKTSVAAAGGVTIDSSGSLLGLAAQYAGMALTKIATDTWLLIGNLG